MKNLNQALGKQRLLAKTYEDEEPDTESEYSASEEFAVSRKAHICGAKVKWIIVVLVILNSATLILLVISLEKHISMRTKRASFFPEGKSRTQKEMITLIAKNHSVGYEQVEISKDTRFIEPASPETDFLWNSVMPGKQGTIVIEDPEKYGLQGDRNGKGANVWGVSWTHQYHCLVSISQPRNGQCWHLLIFLKQMLRSEFWLMVRNESKFVGIGDLDTGALPHLAHCFDYLRQSVLCSMDTTIEWPTGDQIMAERLAISGYGISHACKKRVRSCFHLARTLLIES